MLSLENRFHRSKRNPQGWDQVIWLRYKTREGTHGKTALERVALKCFILAHGLLCVDQTSAQKYCTKSSHFHPCLPLEYEDITKLSPSFLTGKSICIFLLVVSFEHWRKSFILLQPSKINTISSAFSGTCPGIEVRVFAYNRSCSLLMSHSYPISTIE